MASQPSSSSEQPRIKQEKGGLVKWLYPGADQQEQEAVIMSNNQEEESVKKTVEEEEQSSMQAKTSPSSTSAGPDSDVASVDEVPDVEEDDVAKEGVTEELSHKVTAGATYVSSLFSSAWTKTAKTANDATANSTSFISSALSKVAPNSAAENNAEDKSEGKAEDKDEKEIEAATEKKQATSIAAASNLFNSAISGFGFGKSTNSAENVETTENAAEKTEVNEKSEEGNGGVTGGGFGGFSLSALSKAAADATMSIKDKVVSGNNMLAEFNKEQESFIKSNNKSDLVGVAPWVGYQGEDELKAKILSLSEDKRNFVRAPPSGVTFEFEYSSVSSTASALLQEDPRLEKMRYELVPKAVKEEDFWRNYFYRLNLIKQSFDLKDFEQEEKQKKKNNDKKTVAAAAKKQSANKRSEEIDDMGHDDDEFVSDSYQASTSDLAEADETMKKLGVAEDDLEAELEGELNEYEVVDGKGQDGENPDWENQIQEMLEAESSDLK